MPARSEAEEITPTGVRFQDEYSFLLRNTPQLSWGRRLLCHLRANKLLISWLVQLLQQPRAPLHKHLAITEHVYEFGLKRFENPCVVAYQQQPHAVFDGFF